ncbi:MAG: topoisomerase DNA-binding C4 zinc finger domain-containing protein, partial [Gammaproteobacteria bacterium]|nr:topoisomerase DNA-binding C4 zinc finger domain-containing protein [Gammaproteobacteria bacterium]
GLQQEASKRWSMGAQQVLDSAQALYETHKATTYPRTDSTFLPESQWVDAPQVMKALAQSDPALGDWVQRANLNIKSRAWNDKRVTAHHAIIPTAARVNLGRLSADELKLYDLVRRRYVAQFYPDHEYDQTTIQTEVGEDRFRTTGRMARVPGWKDVLGVTHEPNDAENENSVQRLPTVAQGEAVAVSDVEVQAKQTQPLQHYTEGTLIAAMKSIGKLVADPKLKSVLKETAGIGTEATRASIIETLFKRAFVRKQGKKYLLSTPAGRALIAAVPDQVKDPATTARWEQALDDIAQGAGSLQAFLDAQAAWVAGIVATPISFDAGVTAVNAHDDKNTPARTCPGCGKPMRMRKGSSGPFWGCSGYPDCKKTLPAEGKKRRAATVRVPVDKKAGTKCPTCSKGSLVQRTVKSGKNAGKPFVGCSCYPNCDHFSWRT